MESGFIKGPGFDEKSRNQVFTAITEKYPFVEKGVFAKSLCGRDLKYLSIGGKEEQVIFSAAFHGMEWLTSLVVLAFAARVCEALASGTKIAGVYIRPFIEKRGLLVVPCVNPDGVEISLNGAGMACEYEELVTKVSGGDTSRWQANARGVDINHNFPAGWEELHKMEQEAGIIGPAPTRYGGPEAASEPETRAMIDICKERAFRHALAFHSQGEEIYWKYGDNTPKDARLMAEIMAKSSGYSLAEPQGLAVGGGFKDWFIEEFRKPAFTIEIGKGQNPLPISDFKEIYEQIEEMLVYSAIM